MAKKKYKIKKKPLIRRIKDALQFFYHNYTILAISCALACTVLFLFALLPPLIATLAVGFSSIGSYLIYERKRRATWEKYISFKMLQSEGKISLQKEHEPINVTQEELTAVTPLTSLTQNSRRYDSIAINEDIIIDDENNTEKRRSFSPPRPTKPIEEEHKGHTYNETIIREFLDNAIRKKQITVHQQPIMEIPKFQAHFYKLRAEIETYDDLHLTEDEYKAVAEKYNIDGQILTLLLNHTINKIEDGSALNYIIPIKPKTLHHAAFMNTFLAYYKASPTQARQIILSMSFEDFKKQRPNKSPPCVN